ncbi:xanthine dehydrogenase accessory protein XdhC [Aquamicrobium segne]|uniref:Xanthine dehydrogenase accessory protein XdhC n=1 Tax=Aquamicrobium segne TaxID=469547 RepID=A0ABW0GX24_9HYPH
MASFTRDLKNFLERSERFALVKVADTKGSTPREKGAFMLVSPSTSHGTIGGGQLEYMAIDEARQLLARGKAATMLDVPLGPEIGQCCGGRVVVEICAGDDALAKDLISKARQQEAELPHLYIFGGGHVGKAMAAASLLLPVHVVVVETRAHELEEIAPGIATLLTPMPEEAVRAAPKGSAFAVLTHDHALDFLIVAEALKRGDAAYVGMIGSKTKKATFRSWFLKSAGGTEKEFAQLVSPIGGALVHDKRPAVIAALAAAEIMTALALHESAKTASPSGCL